MDFLSKREGRGRSGKGKGRRGRVGETGGRGDPEDEGVCVVLGCLHVYLGMNCLCWVIR